jgi:molybdopterin converting factor small subunit
MPSVRSLPAVFVIRFFARYADLFGTTELELPAEGLVTVRDILARLRSMPGGALLGASTLVAVNLRQARLDDAVAPGDEIAILPPLAGG